ncbi:MAG: UDP-N-acetylmuramoyl-L-alanine--D-glutamate ligase [Bacteroidia bacterium]|nr:MAG: UDP-N-acetylmuramoyl-L-alanine--D-glutamate ligase [Bacteroidia bacterium]
MDKIGRFFHERFRGKRLAILGFGREGRSTLRCISRYMPGYPVIISDRNPNMETNDPVVLQSGSVSWHTGPDYLKVLEGADIIIKSPGIPFTVMDGLDIHGVITSQTELFLELFRDQVVGITGTKGKSTTASLLYHILRESGEAAVIAGNIGIPCFEILEEVAPGTPVVLEMSSHQLQHIRLSPHVAVLLNIFEEHLDYYGSFEAYRDAKLNIARWQKTGDVFVFNKASRGLQSIMSLFDTQAEKISVGVACPGAGQIRCDGPDLVFTRKGQSLTFSDICHQSMIIGQHNLENMAAAVAVALLLGAGPGSIPRAVSGFKGLPHRMQHAGTCGGVIFYNDSIATIPEATIAAIKALPDTETLILGGTDRGIDYGPLMHFLAGSAVSRFFFTGPAGRRMHALAKAMEGFRGKQLIFSELFDEAVIQAARHTSRGKICLLSPAAASYDQFTNFEERGQRFIDLAQNA